MHTKSCHCKNITITGTNHEIDELTPLISHAHLHHIHKHKGTLMKIEESSIQILFPQYISITPLHQNSCTLKCNSCNSIDNIYYLQNKEAIVNILNHDDNKSDFPSKECSLHSYFPFQLRSFVEFAPLNQTNMEDENLSRENGVSDIKDIDDDFEFQTLFSDSTVCFVGSFIDYNKEARAKAEDL